MTMQQDTPAGPYNCATGDGGPFAHAAVVFPNRKEIEAWYQCPGRYEPWPEDAGKPMRRMRLVADTCGFRAPWEDAEWAINRSGDKDCPRCGGGAPLSPVPCNWRIVCGCEHDGCDLSDCVMGVAEDGMCPMGCPDATLEEIKMEMPR